MFQWNFIEPFLSISHKKVYNYIIIFFKKREKRLVKSVGFLPLSIKSINPIQKYPHFTESYACILKNIACIFLLPINLLIYFGMWSRQKLPK